MKKVMIGVGITLFILTVMNIFNLVLSGDFNDDDYDYMKGEIIEKNKYGR